MERLSGRRSRARDDGRSLTAPTAGQAIRASPGEVAAHGPPQYRLDWTRQPEFTSHAL